MIDGAKVRVRGSQDCILFDSGRFYATINNTDRSQDYIAEYLEGAKDCDWEEIPFEPQDGQWAYGRKPDAPLAGMLGIYVKGQGLRTGQRTIRPFPEYLPYKGEAQPWMKDVEQALKK